MFSSRFGNIIRIFLPFTGRLARSASISFVRGDSNARSLSTMSCSFATLSDKADLIARRRIFFGTSWWYSFGLGPKTTPPWRYCGARVLPCRARPVPFCLYGFLPPPDTSPRVFTLCVPCRAAASWATTTWCISGMFACTLKMSSGSSTVRVGSPPADRTSTLSSEGMSLTALLRRRADQHQRALGTRDGALDQDQVLLRVDRLDGQVLHGVARVAHATGHAHPLEDPARRGAGADRAGRAVLALDTVARLQAVEAVPLHHTGETLALGTAGYVHDLAGREGLRRH